ncbi:ubiquinone-dependent pyruvate dehydrogenase, partial [Acinetobacter baumannii]
NPDILPNKSELNQIVQLISQHQRIGIYAGAGCEDAHDQLVAFAEKLKAPVAHTSRAKDFVEYDNPYNMGMTGIFGNKAGYHTLMDCDLLILLGTDFAWAQYYPSHAKILQIDIDPTHLGRRHPITLGAVGKISSTLDALLPLLETRHERDFLDHCLALKHESDEIRRKEERVGKDGLIHPQYLVSLLNRYADQDAIFFGDGGSPMVWVL